MHHLAFLDVQSTLVGLVGRGLTDFIRLAGIRDHTTAISSEGLLYQDRGISTPNRID